MVAQVSPVYATGVDAETRLLDYNIFREYWAGGEMVDAQRSGRCEATLGGSNPPLPTKIEESYPRGTILYFTGI